MRRRFMLVAVAAAAAIVAPAALSARTHSFRASYSGHASGQVTGTSASGRATAHGRGRPIGAGTLTGSATGEFTSRTCATFDGNAVLRGSAGTLTLAAHGAHACAASTDPDTSVSFSGSVRVTDGTATFAGARGTLSFSGTYDGRTGTVTVAFSGRVRY